MQTDTQKHNETVTPNSKEIEILKKYFPQCFSVNDGFVRKRLLYFFSRRGLIKKPMALQKCQWHKSSCDSFTKMPVA